MLERATGLRGKDNFTVIEELIEATWIEEMKQIQKAITLMADGLITNQHQNNHN
jgi:hypothetical protein